MSEFPVGWFFIQCPSRQDHVLTVSSLSMQPSIRVELRPKKKIGVMNRHQLWCYNQGYLVNKHSGCVLGVEKDKLKDQCIYQSRRSSEGTDRKKQLWKYDENQRLVLTDDKNGVYGLTALAVPKLDSNLENA
ncbi:hypothetical protein INT47_001562, partial [Mucor saturninus]